MDAKRKIKRLESTTPTSVIVNLNSVSTENTAAALSTLTEDSITDNNPPILARHINIDQYINNTIDNEGNKERKNLQKIADNEEEIALQDTDNEYDGSELQ